ncbi:hypothetical protein G6F58_013901 [Rhizopus delemar]|nr:hypothetical protein G6F24_018997 [Rhizopus arrhizus]KAG1385929.1 hypothetical protein G6F58_013901 [Rhizopus delemar]
MPMRTRSSTGSASRSRPSNAIVPAIRGKSPITALTSVDLPAPLVPAMVTISLAATVMSMPLTISTSA